MTELSRIVNTVSPYVDAESLKKLQSGDPEVVLDELTRLAGTHALGQLSETEVAEMLAAIRELGSSQGKGGLDGITNPNGSPVIDDVQFDFSPEDMAMALQALQGKTQQGQLETAKQGLTMNEIRLSQKHAEALKKLDDMIAKSKEAAEKGKAGDVLGWIGKIAAVVAAGLAVALAVATGGLATPLAVLAICGAVGAVVSLASSISQAAGGPALEFSSLLGKAMTAIVKAVDPNMDEKKAEAMGKLIAGVAFVALAVVDPGMIGNIAGGIAGMVNPNDETAIAMAQGIATAVAGLAICIATVVLSGGAKIGELAKNISDTAVLGMKIAQGTVGIASGAVAVSAGGVRIAKAFDEHDLAKAQSDKTKIDAIITKLMKQMEEDREYIKKVMDEIQEGMTLVSQIIAAGAQSRTQLSTNLGAKQTI
jgi:transloator